MTANDELFLLTIVQPDGDSFTAFGSIESCEDIDDRTIRYTVRSGYDDRLFDAVLAWRENDE